MRYNIIKRIIGFIANNPITPRTYNSNSSHNLLFIGINKKNLNKKNGCPRRTQLNKRERYTIHYISRGYSESGPSTFKGKSFEWPKAHRHRTRGRDYPTIFQRGREGRK